MFVQAAGTRRCRWASSPATDYDQLHFRLPPSSYDAIYSLTRGSSILQTVQTQSIMPQAPQF